MKEVLFKLRIKTSVTTLIFIGITSIILAQNNSSKEQWTCYTDKETLITGDYQILGIFEYVDGSLWIVTDKGINIFDGEKWKKLDKKSGATKKKISSYLLDSKNRIWLGTNPEAYAGPSFLSSYDDVVRIYDGDTWKSMKTKDMGFKAPVVTKMFESSNGDIWLGASSHLSGAEDSNIFSKGALLRFSNDEWTVYKSKDLPCLSCEFVKGFYEDDNGRQYFWGNNGLYYFENSSFHGVKKDQGYNIRDRVVNTVFEDSKGNFWMGAPARIAKYNGKVWKTYNRKNGLPERSWWPLGFTETKDGQIILSMSNGLYYLDSNEQWVREKRQIVRSKVHIDNEDRIWIPTHKGLEIKNGQNREIHKDIPNIWKIMEDKNGGTWALSWNKGVKRYKDGKWSYHTDKNDLPSDKIKLGYVSKDGSIWIGTKKGICSCTYNE